MRKPYGETEFRSDFSFGFAILFACGWTTLSTFVGAFWYGLLGMFLGGMWVLVGSVWKRGRAIKRGEP